jgi:hypothetical protein
MDEGTTADRPTSSGSDAADSGTADLFHDLVGQRRPRSARSSIASISDGH